MNGLRQQYFSSFVLFFISIPKSRFYQKYDSISINWLVMNCNVLRETQELSFPVYSLVQLVINCNIVLKFSSQNMFPLALLESKKEIFTLYHFVSDYCMVCTIMGFRLCSFPTFMTWYILNLSSH